MPFDPTPSAPVVAKPDLSTLTPESAAYIVEHKEEWPSRWSWCFRIVEEDLVDGSRCGCAAGILQNRFGIRKFHEFLNANHSRVDAYSGAYSRANGMDFSPSGIAQAIRAIG